MRYCRECGTALSDEATFCTNCGIELRPLNPIVAPVQEPVASEPLPVEEDATSVFSEPTMDSEVEAYTKPLEDEVPEEVFDEQGFTAPVIDEYEQPTVEPVYDQAVVEPVYNQTAANQGYSQQVNEAPVAPAQQPVVPVMNEQTKPATTVVYTEDKKQTLSTGAYFGLMILFAIPVIGLIFMFIWACGQPKNKSLKRFSAAALILRLITLILFMAAVIVFLILFRDKFDPIFRAICQMISDVAAAFGY
ncbi:MAG: zinc-ribbon domain-containing protein [Clostridia bacterium]|nr:zinc-ribbon domain-containing protein [Clostridia bacterium]